MHQWMTQWESYLFLIPIAVGLVCLRIWRRNTVHRHQWVQVTKRSPMRRIYSTRKCACGAHEILHDGPMGDRVWHPLSEGLSAAWLQDDFDAAVPTETGSTQPRRPPC